MHSVSMIGRTFLPRQPDAKFQEIHISFPLIGHHNLPFPVKDYFSQLFQADSVPLTLAGIILLKKAFDFICRKYSADVGNANP